MRQHLQIQLQTHLIACFEGEAFNMFSAVILARNIPHSHSYTQRSLALDYHPRLLGIFQSEAYMRVP